MISHLLSTLIEIILLEIKAIYAIIQVCMLFIIWIFRKLLPCIKTWTLAYYKYLQPLRP